MGVRPPAISPPPVLRPAPICAGFVLALPAAAQLHVPGDHADLQDALDAAPLDGTVIVHGGVHGPVTISQPVRLVGDPAPLLVAGAPNPAPPITLVGPGSGVVALVDVRTGGALAGDGSAPAPAGIAGGGFDQLHLVDCEVLGPAWSGPAVPVSGSPGVDVDLPHVLAVTSVVRASGALQPGCGPVGPDGAPGLRSTGAVTLLDAEVEGGAAGPTWCSDLPGCGGTCPDGGRGGDAVVCSALYSDGANLVGGPGAQWVDPGGSPCCPAPVDGQPMVAGSQSALAPGLSGPSIIPLGGTWELSWQTPGSSLWLFASSGSTHPLELPGLGVIYVDLSGMLLLGIFSGGTQTLPFSVGSSPVLVGSRVCFQGLGDVLGITRPVVAAFAP